MEGEERLIIKATLTGQGLHAANEEAEALRAVDRGGAGGPSRREAQARPRATAPAAAVPQQLQQSALEGSGAGPAPSEIPVEQSDDDGQEFDVEAIIGARWATTKTNLEYPGGATSGIDFHVKWDDVQATPSWEPTSETLFGIVYGTNFGEEKGMVNRRIVCTFAKGSQNNTNDNDTLDDDKRRKRKQSGVAGIVTEVPGLWQDSRICLYMAIYNANMSRCDLVVSRGPGGLTLALLVLLPEY